jgi:hypothetical protein
MWENIRWGFILRLANDSSWYLLSREQSGYLKFPLLGGLLTGHAGSPQKSPSGTIRARIGNSPSQSLAQGLQEQQ